MLFFYCYIIHALRKELASLTNRCPRNTLSFPHFNLIDFKKFHLEGSEVTKFSVTFYVYNCYLKYVCKCFKSCSLPHRTLESLIKN